MAGILVMESVAVASSLVDRDETTWAVRNMERSKVAQLVVLTEVARVVAELVALTEAARAAEESEEEAMVVQVEAMAMMAGEALLEATAAAVPCTATQIPICIHASHRFA